VCFAAGLNRGECNIRSRTTRIREKSGNCKPFGGKRYKGSGISKDLNLSAMEILAYGLVPPTMLIVGVRVDKPSLVARSILTSSPFHCKAPCPSRGFRLESRPSKKSAALQVYIRRSG
jgi:hypothetical protein